MYERVMGVDTEYAFRVFSSSAPSEVRTRVCLRRITGLATEVPGELQPGQHCFISLRHDRHWDTTTWTVKHRDWIRTQKFAYPAQQRVRSRLAGRGRPKARRRQNSKSPAK